MSDAHNRHVTIKDIARDLGVSIATVSLALNSSPRVTEQTRRKVLEAAERLGYHRNAIARALVMNKTVRVGVIVPDITQLFFSEMIRAAQQVATERGYDILIGNTDRDRELEAHYLRLITERQIDGVILTSVDFEETLLEQVLGSGFSLVFVNNIYPGYTGPFVGTDSELGGYLAGSHLLKLGHRKIALLSADSGAPFNSRRIAGFRRAFRDAQAAFPEELVLEGDFTVESGYRLTVELIKQRRDVTAIFAATDMIAIGAMKALKQAGIRIPEEISVVGFDDLVIAAFPGIELTTVRQEIATVGSSAMKLLLDQLEGAGAAPEAPENVLVPPEMVIRKTTAVAPDISKR